MYVSYGVILKYYNIFNINIGELLIIIYNFQKKFIYTFKNQSFHFIIFYIYYLNL